MIITPPPGSNIAIKNSDGTVSAVVSSIKFVNATVGIAGSEATVTPAGGGGAPTFSKSAGSSNFTETFVTNPAARVSTMSPFGTAITTTWNSGESAYTIDSVTNAGVVVLKESPLDQNLFSVAANIRIDTDYGDSRHAGVYLMTSSAQVDGYRFAYYKVPGGGLQFDLYRQSNNANYNVLTIVSTAINLAVGTTNEFKLTYNRTTGELNGYFNGALVATVTNSAYLNQPIFYPGFFCFKSAATFFDVTVTEQGGTVANLPVTLKARAKGIDFGSGSVNVIASNYTHIEDMQGRVVAQLWVNLGDIWTYVP